MDDATRAKMIDFCVREAREASDPHVAYISALTSVAHLCDQVARENTKRKGDRPRGEAARACGDFIWSVADAVKADRVKKQTT